MIASLSFHAPHPQMFARSFQDDERPPPLSVRLDGAQRAPSGWDGKLGSSEGGIEIEISLEWLSGEMEFPPYSVFEMIFGA